MAFAKLLIFPKDGLTCARSPKQAAAAVGFVGDVLHIRMISVGKRPSASICQRYSVTTDEDNSAPLHRT